MSIGLFLFLFDDYNCPKSIFLSVIEAGSQFKDIFNNFLPFLVLFLRGDIPFFFASSSFWLLCLKISLNFNLISLRK